MAKCDYCGTTIILGGKKDGNFRFCNDRCREKGYVLSLAKQVPSDVLDRNTEEIFRGNCPRCHSLGPVDVHKVHRVWSALVLTSWSSTPQVCCRSCATKSQIGGILYSLILGWWGFPWGIFLTPVQITRNLVGLVRGPDLSRPSDDLRKLILVSLAAQLAEARRRTPAQSPPLIPKQANQAQY